MNMAGNQRTRPTIDLELVRQTTGGGTTRCMVLLVSGIDPAQHTPWQRVTDATLISLWTVRVSSEWRAHWTPTRRPTEGHPVSQLASQMTSVRQGVSSDLLTSCTTCLGTQGADAFARRNKWQHGSCRWKPRRVQRYTALRCMSYF